MDEWKWNRAAQKIIIHIPFLIARYAIMDPLLSSLNDRLESNISPSLYEVERLLAVLFCELRQECPLSFKMSSPLLISRTTLGTNRGEMLRNVFLLEDPSMTL